MPLPHFTQLLNTGSPGGPGTLPDEVVYTNLFEITFVLPVILQAQGRNPILLLQNAFAFAYWNPFVKTLFNFVVKTCVDFTLHENFNICL